MLELNEDSNWHCHLQRIGFTSKWLIRGVPTSMANKFFLSGSLLGSHPPFFLLFSLQMELTSDLKYLTKPFIIILSCKKINFKASGKKQGGDCCLRHQENSREWKYLCHSHPAPLSVGRDMYLFPLAEKVRLREKINFLHTCFNWI